MTQEQIAKILADIIGEEYGVKLSGHIERGCADADTCPAVHSA